MHNARINIAFHLGEIKRITPKSLDLKSGGAFAVAKGVTLFTSSGFYC